MFSYRVQIAVGVLCFSMGVIGMCWRLYRLHFAPLSRPMIQVYIALLGFFLLGLFGLYALATAHRSNRPRLPEVLPPSMLCAPANCSADPVHHEHYSHPLELMPPQVVKKLEICGMAAG
jgi:hypothetical protein